MATKLYLVLALTIATSALCAQALWDKIIQFDTKNHSVNFPQLCFVKYTLMGTMEHFKGEAAYERLQTDLTRINKAVTSASLLNRDYEECDHHSECVPLVKVNLTRTKSEDNDSVAEAYAAVKETVKTGLTDYIECWQDAEAEEVEKEKEETDRWLEESAKERRREEKEAARYDDDYDSDDDSDDDNGW